MTGHPALFGAVAWNLRAQGLDFVFYVDLARLLGGESSLDCRAKFWPFRCPWTAASPIFTNGRAFPSTDTMRMRVGEKLKVRFVGSNNGFIHPMHIHGGPFVVVARQRAATNEDVTGVGRDCSALEATKVQLAHCPLKRLGIKRVQRTASAG